MAVAHCVLRGAAEPSRVEDGMEKRHAFFSVALLLISFLGGPPGTAETLGPISEETPPATCNPGAFVTGIRCTGPYCDKIQISCAPFQNATLGQGSWTAWVSEEAGGRKECPASHLITGLPGGGRYCDNISLYCVEVTNMRAESCRDTRFVSEEQGGSLSFREWIDVAGQMLFAK